MNLLNNYKVQILNNAAMSLIKKKDYNEALKWLADLFKIEKENPKALFREGLCKKGIGEFAAAIGSFEKCSALDISAVEDCSQMIEKCKNLLDQANKREKDSFSKLFGREKPSLEGEVGNAIVKKIKI